MFVLLALGVMIAISRVDAQDFGLSVSVSPPSPVGVSNNLAYTIIITNQTGMPQTVTLTNTLTGTSFQMVGLPTHSQGADSVGSSDVIFSLGLMTNNAVAQMGMTVKPTSIGFLTNTIVLATNSMFFNSLPPFVVQVTNPIPVADLAVAMTRPSSEVFTNDYMTYGVNVTNLGPDTVIGVFLTNTLPSSVGYITNSLALTHLGSGSNVIFNLGTLTNGAFKNFILTVQPTNAGNLTFMSLVGTNGVIDPNPTNNVASIGVVVSNFLSNPGQLTATIVSTQQFNPQNSLMEQLIVVSNAGPSVPAARVIVSGLTNFLYNAVGTNDGNPFVVYDAALDSTQSACLLLQYFVPSHRTSPDPQLTAVGVTVPDLSPPANLSTNIHILGIVQMSSGDMLIAFPSISNQTYTVEYTVNLLSPTWLATQPAVMATANFTQWIDYGPPGTVSHPTNTPMRFYRVFLNH